MNSIAWRPYLWPHNAATSNPHLRGHFASLLGALPRLRFSVRALVPLVAAVMSPLAALTCFDVRVDLPADLLKGLKKCGPALFEPSWQFLRHNRNRISVLLVSRVLIRTRSFDVSRLSTSDASPPRNTGVWRCSTSATWARPHVIPFFKLQRLVANCKQEGDET